LSYDEDLIYEDESGSSTDSQIDWRKESIGYTASFWSIQAATYISSECAREMATNISGFIDVLACWDTSASPTATLPAYSKSREQYSGFPIFTATGVAADYSHREEV